MLAVVYLVFNEGYVASAGDELVRAELCAEAIRLARLLVELMPDEAEAHGLLALLLLTESRRAARTDADGPAGAPRRPGPRAAGTAALIAEGQAIVRGLPAPQPARAVPDPGRHRRRAQRRRRSRRHRLGPDRRALRPARSPSRPTPVVALNRAIAVAERDGPAAGAGPARRPGATSTATTSSTPPGPSCSSGSVATDDAAAAYDEALARTANGAERDLLQRQLVALQPPG